MLVSKGTGRYQSLQHAHRLSLAKESGGLRSQSLPESVRSPQQSTGTCIDRHVIHVQAHNIDQEPVSAQ